MQLTVGFACLWDSSASADLTGGAQAVKQARGVAVNTDKALVSCLLATHLWLCGPVPNRSVAQWLWNPALRPLQGLPLEPLHSARQQDMREGKETAWTILGARLGSSKHHCHFLPRGRRFSPRSSLARAPWLFLSSVLFSSALCSRGPQGGHPHCDKKAASWIQGIGCSCWKGEKGKKRKRKGEKEKTFLFSKETWATLSSHLTDMKWLRTAQSWNSQWQRNYYEWV